MKKFSMLLVVVLLLVLSGCGEVDDAIEVVGSVGSYDIEDYYTQEEVDELIKEGINDFEDSLEDDFEWYQDELDKLEQRIEELETINQFKIHRYNDTQYIFVVYTYNSYKYNIEIFGGCIDLCEQTTDYTYEYTQEEFDNWWNARINEYSDYIEHD